MSVALGVSVELELGTGEEDCVSVWVSVPLGVHACLAVDVPLPDGMTLRACACEAVDNKDAVSEVLREDATLRHASCEAPSTSETVVWDNDSVSV